MRRMILFAVVAAIVSATLAMPAAAAPVKNSLTFDVTCEGEAAFVVSAVGVPGWMYIDDGLAQVPALLIGGTFTIYGYEGGPMIGYAQNQQPPGLASKQKTCVVTGPHESADVGFYLVADPAYIFFPGP